MSIKAKTLRSPLDPLSPLYFIGLEKFPGLQNNMQSVRVGASHLHLIGTEIFAEFCGQSRAQLRIFWQL